MYNLYNNLSHKDSSSCVYNPHEQNQAISSAEEQVSIANDTLKQATSNLTYRADALQVAVDNYLNRMNEIASFKSSESAKDEVSGSTDSKAQEYNVNHSFLSQPSHSNVSNAANASNSMGNLLVSLKSGTGIIYSLINRKH